MPNHLKKKLKNQSKQILHEKEPNQPPLFNQCQTEGIQNSKAGSDVLDDSTLKDASENDKYANSDTISLRPGGSFAPSSSNAECGRKRNRSSHEEEFQSFFHAQRMNYYNRSKM